MKAGNDVGGGLFDAIKNLFKKGKKKAKKVASKVATGVKKGVALAGKGAKGAINIGNQLNSALERGLEISNALKPAAALLGDPASEALARAQGFAQNVKGRVEQGTQLAQRASDAIDPIQAALGPVDAPLFKPAVQA